MRSLRWNASRSGKRVTYQGDVFKPRAGHDVSPAQVFAGRVIEARRYAVGELGIPRCRLPHATREGIDRLLFDYGFHLQAAGHELVKIISRIFQHWTLPDEHHALMLQRVLLAEELLILDTVTDMTGREVLRLGREPSTEAPTDMLLVSHRTHRIVGQERATGCLADQVVRFRLWDFG
jgi:hypothetical protein